MMLTIYEALRAVPKETEESVKPIVDTLNKNGFDC
eukprot:CAMPEP_0202864796 /NCGR_PEP_ID=MMETSP1391-20130828/4889_1 /ASSEMBLY_ACC=CAM_ASM_000867 /TAXON_ID=1034604 /ORGANISM="Chlamydomonas leiostraca, Strain SAG 11-49" /LENGTH=34 /DNA_ID= /DNA_START= /DNA_END= /DNA_ORIENTATION=